MAEVVNLSEYMDCATAGAILGVTAGYIRDSDCPKYYLPGNGKKGKPIIRIKRSEFDAWVEQYAARATAPQRRQRSA